MLFFSRPYYRGQRCEEIEREYFDVYYPIDERVPRLRRLPDSKVVHVGNLFTSQELKTSPVYNEMLPRGDYQNSLNVRLDGPSGTRIVWGVADPISGGDWSLADRIDRVYLAPPPSVSFRQALVDAEALGTSLTGLLDNSRSCVIQLDWRGQIVAANDAAQDLLRRGDGLSDQYLARMVQPSEDANLQRLLGRALPRFGSQGASGSMTVRRPSVLTRLALHISPLGDGRRDSCSLRVSALVLIVDPASRARIDPGLVVEVLGLTPAEGQVAVLLAEAQDGPRNGCGDGP